MTAFTTRDEMVARSVGDISIAAHSLLCETGRRWFFRGVTSKEHDLLPSGKRKYSPERERHFYNEFYCRAAVRHSHCPDDDDIARWLSLMQHYRLPTRLLDWTFSPLIAAYFAVGKWNATLLEDACIWAVCPETLNVSQGFEPYLYPLTANRLRLILTPAKKGADTSDCIVAAMAVESDARMQMQQGAFTVHASATPLNRLTSCQNWLRRLIIRAEDLPRLKSELRAIGYRKDYLFPDLESLADELKSLYPPDVV